jgi:hypothetical protein
VADRLTADGFRLRDPNDRAVRRGRDVCERIAAYVLDMKARGKHPVEVRIANHVADDMRAFFESFAKFDGVLPQQVHGVRLLIGGTGGDDMAIGFGKPSQ